MREKQERETQWILITAKFLSPWSWCRVIEVSFASLSFWNLSLVMNYTWILSHSEPSSWWWEESVGGEGGGLSGTHLYSDKTSCNTRLSDVTALREWRSFLFRNNAVLSLLAPKNCTMQTNVRDVRTETKRRWGTKRRKKQKNHQTQEGEDACKYQSRLTLDDNADREVNIMRESIFNNIEDTIIPSLISNLRYLFLNSLWRLDSSQQLRKDCKKE